MQSSTNTIWCNVSTVTSASFQIFTFTIWTVLNYLGSPWEVTFICTSIVILEHEPMMHREVAASTRWPLHCFLSNESPEIAFKRCLGFGTLNKYISDINWSHISVTAFISLESLPRGRRTAQCPLCRCEACLRLPSLAKWLHPYRVHFDVTC